jgi:glyoxylase-like metal-dependent hydrolase (beta-lactamase superfamily II)
MAFLTEPEPVRGERQSVLPGIDRVVAANPSVMTYHGTNTYLIDTDTGLVLLDPGPDDAAHVAAVVRAIDRRKVAGILLSHTHRDHAGAVPALRRATGAPVASFRTSSAADHRPDIPLDDGQAVHGLLAIHTPGHAADHLCFAREDGVLFSADHVMSWSSSIVNPPDGVMADYFASLRRLLAREQDTTYLPGHGPALPEPLGLVSDLLKHRMEREEAIRTALDRGPTTVEALMDALYSQTHPMLRRAAERNVLAHLIKLEAEGAATRTGALWRAVEG